MPEDRTFLMGKFPAVLPGGLCYARNHMWCRAVGAASRAAPDGPAWLAGPTGSGRGRFGFTSYAIRLMQDVYFLDWQINAGDRVELLQQIGHIETSKAVSDLFAPLAGTLLEFNPELLKDPSGINVDGYGAGWLFDMECAADTLLSVEDYHQYLADNWEKTQRLIKGKINIED
jgi:glycine cleavage system H protein